MLKVVDNAASGTAQVGGMDDVGLCVWLGVRRQGRPPGVPRVLGPPGPLGRRRDRRDHRDHRDRRDYRDQTTLGPSIETAGTIETAETTRGCWKS